MSSTGFEWSVGFEFQTPDANLLVQKEGAGKEGDPIKLYYSSTYQQLLLMNEDDVQLKVSGDGFTSPLVKKFCENWTKTYLAKYGGGVSILLRCESDGPGKRKRQQSRHKEMRIDLDQNFNEIFNDLEFDFLFPKKKMLTSTSSQCILNGIKNAVKNAAETLLQSLKANTTSYSMTSLLLNYEGKILGELTEKQFLYRRAFCFTPKDSAPVYFLSPKNKTIPSFHYYTQMTLGVPLRHILDVMTVLNEECIRYQSHMHPHDLDQLSIFPTAKRDVDRVFPSDTHPVVYSIGVLFVYWSRTRTIRKSAVFILRHYMTRMIHKFLTTQERTILKYYIRQISPDLTKELDQFSTLHGKTKHEPFSLLRNHAALFQGVTTTTVFPLSLEDTKAATQYRLDTPILFEFRFLNTLLEGWCDKTSSLLTLPELSSIRVTADRASRRKS